MNELDLRTRDIEFDKDFLEVRALVNNHRFTLRLVSCCGRCECTAARRFCRIEKADNDEPETDLTKSFVLQRRMSKLLFGHICSS